MNRIKVMIVDDHHVVLDGLQTLIQTRATDMEVVATAVNGREAVEAALAVRPDVILMDLRLPEMDGVEATRAIREQCPGSKILILTSYDEERYIVDGMRAGASGYLLKDVSWAELEAAIHTVHSGGVLMTREVADILVHRKEDRSGKLEEDRLSDAILSGKEKEILRLVAQGYDNKTIARKAFLSEGTVRNYVSRIYELIGVSDRAQAVVWAMRHGLVEGFRDKE